MPENIQGNMPWRPELPQNDLGQEIDKVAKAEFPDAIIAPKDSHAAKEEKIQLPLKLNDVIDSVYSEMAARETPPSEEEIEAAMRQLAYKLHAGRHSAVLSEVDFIQGAKKIAARLRQGETLRADAIKKEFPNKELKINPQRLGETANWVAAQMIESLEAPPTLGEIKAQIQELVRQEGVDTITAADINLMAGQIATELWRKKRWQINRAA